ncbi:GUN4 domain-containing protein [Roseofilum casamattae]|uniref:GUN4 domain-containing protein n=1 Tax=Roseofilum casamattae BLCC-M143 TaxID=3022442 RepID=A0ABT7BZQ6_9CYAN|nr:GUN4 domain-containing protein [Roseofilum casamattae]MDJ1184695.1 GUN4 domain-containing protein [Roseofilum casamattae BLCC-M143]
MNTIKLSVYARQAGVSYKTAWRWWKQGKLKGEQRADGSIWISQSVQPTPEVPDSETLQEIRQQLQEAREERSQLKMLLDEVLQQLRQLQGIPEPSHRPSEVGMDYGYLEELLAAGSWQEANDYTWLLLLALAGYEEGEELSLEEIEELPRTDMDTLDRMWSEYSAGQFGLRVQQNIWHEVEFDYTVFCDRIGWRVQDKWLSYDELHCSLKAPAGHLPAIAWLKRSCYGLSFHSPDEILETLFGLIDLIDN